jgi:hypothetical protein
MPAINELVVLLEKYDGTIKLDTASECCWSCEVRLSLTNPDNAPARSMTFYAVAGDTPETVASAVLGDVKHWLDEENGTPLAVPDYFKD